MKILPIFIPHLGCPFDCVYCNQHHITKTNLPDLNEIKNQIANFCQHHAQQYKEIAFFGGTFTSLPPNQQEELFNLVKPYIDKYTAIRISTRPDAIDTDTLEFCQKNGVKTIELGIQSFSDKVLSATQRGYNSQTAIDSCKLIKNSNFNLGIQLMPGLPGYSSDTIKQSLQQTLSLSPDYVRIYPTIVLQGTKLEDWYKTEKYAPLSLKDAIHIVSNMLEAFELNNINVIKIGLHSDIEPESIIAGPYHETFGELVKAEILKNKITSTYRKGTLVISPKDISLFKGFHATMLNELKSALQIDTLPVFIDNKIPSLQFIIKNIAPQYNW